MEKLREEVSRLRSIREDEKHRWVPGGVAETPEDCAPVRRDLDRLEG